MDALPAADRAGAALARARARFASGATQPVEARLAALRRLRDALAAAEDGLLAALAEDLGKPPFEAWTSEILLVRQELDHAIRRLPRWAAPRRVPVRLMHRPGRASVEPRPKGTTLILGPWNYPVQLLLLPLVSALAAGCTAVLKPSEGAPATAAALAALLRGAFEPGHAEALEGGPELAEALSNRPFDHVFFTGSTAVGRRVAEAAARNLATVTLELGGANPCVADRTADPARTARRIAWGRFLNAGQTCLAPNHLLVEEAAREPLLAALVGAVERQWGPDGAGTQRLASARQLERVEAVLARGRVIHGGRVDRAALRVSPTLLADPDPALLGEEIFGPVLPVVSWRERDALLADLAAAPPPLAVYVHSRDEGLVSAVAAATRSGGLCVNDHLVQATVPELPFGGVGPSGQGRYHGRAGFEAFSDLRSVFRQPAWADLPFRYPPYRAPLSLVRRLLG